MVNRLFQLDDKSQEIRIANDLQANVHGSWTVEWKKFLNPLFRYVKILFGLYNNIFIFIFNVDRL